MHIFAIGASGLVGTRLKVLLQSKYQIDNLSLETGLDITDPQTLQIVEEDVSHTTVIHLAAKADVDGCERDRALGINGDAYRINVLGTKNVVEACLKQRKKIIYISTDFVFDGQKEVDQQYTEEDMPNPLNWYGWTKYEGEKIVLASGLPYMIIRIAYPYRPVPGPRNDFVQSIKERLGAKQPVPAVTDHVMTPTFLDDIAIALDALLNHDAQGVFHVVGSQSLTPYDAALTIAKTFDYHTSLITKTTRNVFFKDRAIRPFNLSIS